MEEEEMDIDADINYEEEYEINDIEKKDSNQNLDYEIVEPNKIIKKRESLIEQFIECSCLNYDEAELILNHFEWNYDKLIDVWYDNMEEIKIDSHIEQSPESIVDITEYIQNNQIYENTCIICSDVRKDEDFIYLKCEHKVCKSCMTANLINILLSEPNKVLSSPCPLKGCNLYITKSIYKECIKDEVMIEVYEENIKSNFINKNKNIKKCPNKKCNYLIKSQDNLPKEIKCKCGQIFCFSCLEEYHSPCFCEMIKSWKLMEKEIKLNNDCPFLKTEARCPCCQNLFDKKTKVGNHMKCDDCEGEFCYNCEQKWETHKSNCLESENRKNRFYSIYNNVINIDNDISLMNELRLKIDNYLLELSKKDLLNSDLEFLNEILYLIKDYYKFYKYLCIFRYFLRSDTDDNFLDYNSSFLNELMNQSLDLLEFDSLPNLVKIPDITNFKHQFLEFKEKILYLIKSIKIYKNNIIQEIEKNIFGKIDYKLLEDPIDSVTWNNVITSLKPQQFIIDIIKSNDFSFCSQKRKSFSTFVYTSSTLSRDDEFIMKLYSQGYAFNMTKYLRTKELNPYCNLYSLSEKEMKSSICCLQHAIFRNKNVANGQVVYRAIKIFRFPNHIKEKSKFYFKEFLSTSTNEKFSFNWLQGKGTFLIITITNNGTNGHKNYCYYIEDITICKQQYEVIFACHCSFILDKIERTQNIDYVYLTCEGYLLD